MRAIRIPWSGWLAWCILAGTALPAGAQPGRAPVPAAPASAVAVPAAPSAEYRVGPKDVLRVTVFGHDDLTRSVTVAPDGTLPFPLVGAIPAAGLTARQLEARLTELLGRDYLVDPQVSVAVEEYRSQRVFVLGEVEKPGAYPLTGQVTLVDVLSQAGGPGKAAGRQLLVIRGAQTDGPSAPGASGSTTLRVTLKRLLEGDRAENVVLQSGDTIFIPKTTSVFVLGEVVKPGAYTLEKDTTPLEAVTLAGGLSETAAPTAKLLRKRDDGAQETVELDLSGADPRVREMLLAEGDTLLVPRGTSYFVSGEVKKPGAYQLGRSSTAFSAITTAGGFTDRAAAGQVKLIRRSAAGEETLVLDLSGGDPRARDLPLRDGDTLLVPSGNAFYVLGEVAKPGAYPLGTGTTATAAITLAGGFTEKAAQAAVKLTRRLPSGQDEITVLDLSGGDKRSREFFLKDGDVLLVPTGNTFYVLGEVKKPGAYQLSQSTTAIQGIAMAGGFTEKAAPGRTKIIRTHRDGHQETLQVDLNDVIKRGARERDPSLTANDVIVVPESFF
jgi:polysaccharide export outer membrane protein